MLKIKAKFIVLFLISLPVIVHSQNAYYTVIPNDNKVIDIRISSYTEDTRLKVHLNEKLNVYLKVDTSITISKAYVYLDNVPIGTLIPFKSSSGCEYYFVIPELTMEKDSLQQILNPDFKESKDATVKFKIDDKYEITLNNKITIVFDKNRGFKRAWLLSTVGILLLIIVVILWKSKFQILKDRNKFQVLKDRSELKENVPISIDDPKMDAVAQKDRSELKENVPFSLSRTQLAFWTLIVAIAFLSVWFKTGRPVALTTQVLLLMGISVGTKSIANLIDKDDILNPKIESRIQDDPHQDFISDILSDGNGLSISRLQNVLFTLIIGSYFLYEVWINNKFPLIDDSLLWLMGISSGTYLFVKKNENIPKQETTTGQSVQH